MKNKKILLVEDDMKLLNSNRLFLESEGYDVLCAKSLADAREQLNVDMPDALVLDILLPDGNGLDFLKELRIENGKWSKIPVLLLTALGTNADIIKGLEAGGDDYLPKPFDAEIFLMRVKAMLRRADRIPETLTKGNLSLLISSGQAFAGDRDMLLSRKEFALLLLLAQNEEVVLSGEYLYEKVWGQAMNEDANSVRFQISRLRKKMTGTGYAIVAEYGDGYRFERE